ncbi:MAG: Stk1 family PASTA domain-containing Ser/Thr kinase [Lachnospiraceae bacterium]|jgi:serine/threonine-protein kinase|nr:Stk1 family PASTA domain-containing Ser/Thr kinase [Lachnospiraceae bacterium]
MIKIGMIIGDRYEILEKIGTGGMSDVYKAKCHKLNRFVAVKVLKQEFSENANFVSKFRIEAQAAAGLSHPNIVNVHDVGEENAIYYIVMELVEGITLKKYIEKKARLSVKEAISIAIQICMGIEAAHNNHIIHRDIKPQNIIISKEGKVKVTDFGIAKAATSNTITSNVMGSVHYTSPEQARGGFSDAKSDIYSLGITLFEMLTGRVAFNGETTVAIAIKHIQEEMPSPREFVAEIPVSVEQIVYKCCQKSPDRRYQTMGELVADLKRSLMNPDEDFVKVVEPDEEASTRPISDVEVAQIKAARLRNAPEVIRPYRRETEERYEAETPAMDEDYFEYDENEEDYNTDREYDYDPRMERVTTVLAVVAAILVGCVVIVLVGRAFGLFQFDFFNQGDADEEVVASGELIEMIGVIGMDQEEAKRALIAIGLTPEIDFAESDQYGSDIVMASSVIEGERADPANNVVLTVSSGSVGIEVPELVGKSEAEAVAALESAGFTVERNEDSDEYIKAGDVLRQDPASGSKVPAGTVVSIWVSLGAEENTVSMPTLIGQTEEDAVIILAEAGLEVGLITEVSHEDPALLGLVCYQSYSVGVPVEKGTVVDFQISVGALGMLYSYMGNIDAPTTEEDPYYKAGTAVRVILTATDGTTLLDTETTSFPQPVNISNIPVASGEVVLRYVNNREEQTINHDDGTVETIPGTAETKEIERLVNFAEQN